VIKVALPPLLEEHINLLRTKGFEIEVNEGKEICVVLKNYPVPIKFWDKETCRMVYSKIFSLRRTIK